MGGDEKGARNIVGQSPDVLIYTNITKKFTQLVDICGTYDGARALVEQSTLVFKGAHPKDNFDQWVEVSGDKQIALRHLKSVPEMLAIPQAKKKFDEIVRLLGGGEAVSAEVLAVVSGRPLDLWYKKSLLKLLGAASRQVWRMWKPGFGSQDVEARIWKPGYRKK